MLFEKNLRRLKTAKKDFDPESHSWDSKINIWYEISRQDSESLFSEWMNRDQKYLNLPLYMPKSLEGIESWRNLYGDMHSSSNVLDEYLDVHCDFHLYQYANSIASYLQEKGISPDDNSHVMTRGVNSLICLGTDDGRCINDLIEKFDPLNLIIAISC